MKCGIAVLVTLMVFLSPSDGAESDVVRIFDPKVRMTKEELNDAMKNANLEKYGFVKTVEVATETDENGKTTTKKTILYSVTDDCSRVKFWENLLEKRLPAFKGSSITSTITKEVQSRIAGRPTKFCKFAVEIHPKYVAKESVLTKRGASIVSAKCFLWCAKTTIMYN